MSPNLPDPAFLQSLRALLGPAGVREPAEAAAYLVEPRGRLRGRAALVVRPADVAQVAEVVRRCAAARVGIVPWAGGTGLVGGQVATDGPPPVVLSVERLNRIRRVSPEDEAMVVEAGVILQDAQAAAEAADRLFPLSLASQGSARIGGLLATNAGGVNVLRYGNARDLTLGVEAVLPDGSVMSGLRALRKDNAGYDLRHLLIGSEGTLGVITAATLRLFARPRHVATAFCAVASPAAAGALLRRLRDAMGEAVSAFELIAGQGLDFLAAHHPETPRPPLIAPWCALVEVGAGRPVEDALADALADAMEAGEATDAAIAQNAAQAQAFWRVREDIPLANARVGAVASHDVSVPLSAVAAFIAAADAAVAAVEPRLRINCFGHMGDGNLHYNLFPPEGAKASDFAAVREAAIRAVHDTADRFGGSISAEHGVGRAKAAELLRYGDPGKLAAMRAIKAALDPAGIMNPGAVVSGAALSAAAWSGAEEATPPAPST